MVGLSEFVGEFTMCGTFEVGGRGECIAGIVQVNWFKE